MRNIMEKLKKIIFLCICIIIIKNNSVCAFPGLKIYRVPGEVRTELNPGLFIISSTFFLIGGLVGIYMIKYIWGKLTIKLAEKFNRNPKYDKDIKETSRKKEKDTVQEILLNNIKENNPDFSRVNFLNSANVLIKELLYTNTELELEKLKDFFRLSLYKKIERRINFLNQNNKFDEYENIRILDSQILKYEDNGVEFIEVGVTANLIEYIKDNNTQEIIAGNEKKYVNNRYIITFVKNEFVDEKEKIEQRVNCPYCGAPIEIAEIGKCDYCGTFVRCGDFKWRITNIRQIITK